MLGAIIGDMVGMPFERSPVKTKDIALFAHGACFTDDTVMSIAVADALLSGVSLVDKLKEWYRRHPHVGYGMTFAKWAAHPTDRDPYQIWETVRRCVWRRPRGWRMTWQRYWNSRGNRQR